MNTVLFPHASIKRTIILVLIPFIFSGCLRVPGYESKPLSVLSGRFNGTSIKKHVTVRAKVMNKKDMTDLFGRRGSWLVRHRRSSFIPLHISIENHGDRSLILSPELISLATVPYQTVCERMSSNGGMWAFGTLMLGYPAGILLGLGGFFAIPIGSSIGSSSLVNIGWISLATGFSLTVATPFVAMSNAVRSSEANKELEIDLYQKMLKDNTVIRPYEHFETLIFVKRSEYKSEFTVSLHPVDEPDTLYTATLRM